MAGSRNKNARNRTRTARKALSELVTGTEAMMCGRPRTTWKDTVMRDVQHIDISREDTVHKATNRGAGLPCVSNGMD